MSISSRPVWVWSATIVLLLSGHLDAIAGDREYAAVTAWGKLQMFQRGDNGQLQHRSYDPDKKEWSGWEAVGKAEISSSPSVLMTGETRMVVFYRGTDNKLYHVCRDKNAGWSRATGLGNRELATGPTAVLVGDQLTVFARGTTGKQMQIYYDKAKQSWTDWSDVD